MWTERRSKLWLTPLVVLSLSCATTPPPGEPSGREAVPPPSLAPRSVSIPDDQPRPAALRLLEETRFTLNVQEAELSSLLLGLGRESPFNVVVEPGQRSLETARRIKKLAADLGIARVWAVANKVGEPEDRRFIAQGLDELDVVGFLPLRPEVLRSGMGFQIFWRSTHRKAGISDSLGDIAFGDVLMVGYPQVDIFFQHINLMVAQGYFEIQLRISVLELI